MEKEILEQTIQANEAVMVYFSGENCGVCKALQPKVKELFNAKFPKIKQIYIPSELFRDTTAQFQVLSVPTLIICFDQKEFLRQSRLISLSDIEQQLSRIYTLYFE